MRVRNLHARLLSGCGVDQAGALIDSLAGRDDRLWPAGNWPAMRFDRPLEVGARGGHGPVRYVVEQYERGLRIVFRFLAPSCFEGTHAYEVEAAADGAVLRHVLDMRAHGPALLSWPLVFQPLHDALLEDSLDKAERSLGRVVHKPARWGMRVRWLRALMRAGGKRKPVSA